MHIKQLIHLRNAFKFIRDTDSTMFVSSDMNDAVLNTMQEHQMIPTNATVSKDSDKISISIIMAVYDIIFFSFFK